MDLPGLSFLYTIAMLAMTFVGFCSVVFVLRQSKKRAVRGFHIINSHGYIEVGLSSVAAAILPPLLGTCGLSILATWQWSSVIIAIGLAAHTWVIDKRFFKITSWRLPTRVWVNSIITGLVVVALVGNVVSYPAEPNVAPIAIAATWRLIMAVEIFLLTLEDFL